MKASNAGPDTAPGTKVEVPLPKGLTHSSHVATTGTYDSSTGVWTIGDLAVTNDDNPVTTDDSPTLTITATVDTGTRGKTLKVKAMISATETLHIKEIARDENGAPRKNDQGEYVLVDQSYDVAVPDQVSGNNMAMDTVTVPSIPNVDPTLIIMCSVIEFSKPGTKVCDPVKTIDPNTGDTLTYGLIGEGHEHFAVQSVTGGAQIVVAQGANIDHSTRASYMLTLTASDGKDQHGNDDASVDTSIDVMIQVLDFTVSLSADDETPRVGEDVTFTITLENSPVPESELWYHWGTRDPDSPNEPFEGITRQGNPGTITVTSNTEETLEYRIQFYYLVGNQEVGTTNSQEIEVNWSNSN